MKQQPNFFLEPVAYYLALGGAVLFLIALAFAASFIIVPIGAVAIGGYVLFRKYQLNKIRSAVYDAPKATESSNNEAAKPVEKYDTPEDFADKYHGKFLQHLEESWDGYSPEPLSNAFTVAFAELYEQESFHNPPPPPASSQRLDVARYLDKLDLWRAKTGDPKNLELFFDVFATAYRDLRKTFPTFIFQKTPEPVTSPLSVRLTLKPSDEWSRVFYDEDVRQRKLFEPLRQQLGANATRISESKIKEPSYADYFADTPLAHFNNRSVPFVLPEETRFAGMWCVAPQGMGKTTLLHDLIIEDLKKDCSIILMDSKGDLIEPFLSMDAIKDRRVVIGPDNPIGMNPLDIPVTDINKAVDNLEYLFSSILDFKLTAAQSMLLKAVLRSLITAFPNPTLGTFQDIMAEGPNKYAEYIRKLEPDLQNFFRNEFFTENIKARRQEVLQRLRLLLDHDLLRSMLMASSTTFRIGDAMDQGKVVIINNSRGRLGIKGAEFFGRFFIAQVLAAAQQRSFRKEKKAAFFYIDECHTVIAHDERVTDILHECRSQRIGLILAHQETTQVAEKVLNALENCAIRFAHPDEEARKLATTMRMDYRTLQCLERGQFGAYVRGLSNEGLIVNVSKPDFSAMKMREPPSDERRVIDEPAPGHTSGKTNSHQRPSAPEPSDSPPTTVRAPGAEMNGKTASQTETSQNATGKTDIPAPRPSGMGDPGEPADTW